MRGPIERNQLFPRDRLMEVVNRGRPDSGVGAVDATDQAFDLAPKLLITRDGIA